MAGRRLERLRAWLDLRAERRWARRLAAIDRLGAGRLGRLARRAERLGRILDRFRAEARGRFLRPEIGSERVIRPPTADWAWRPDPWRLPIVPAGRVIRESPVPLGPSARLFHDCVRPEATLRQRRNDRPDRLCPFALELELFAMDGSFLSIAVDLPEEAARTLSSRRVVQVDTLLETEREIEFLARLNLKRGPNVTRLMRPFLAGEGEMLSAEFDLSETGLREGRVEHAWLDLIIATPPCNRLCILDATVTRRPRAQI